MVDPLGGINTLWPLFGIANQMLAAIALTAVHGRARQDEARALRLGRRSSPTAWLLICTLTAGWQKVFCRRTRIGFVAHARKFAAALDRGQVLAPAKSLGEMQRIVLNDWIDASLAAAFSLLVIAMLGFGIRAVLAARKSSVATAREAPYIALAGAVS